MTTATATRPRSRTLAWAHQAEASSFIEDKRAAMLAMAMGTGKSKVVVDRVMELGLRRVLIVCPHSVVSVWPGQFRTHAEPPFFIAALDTGSVTEKYAEAVRMLRLGRALGQLVVIVINYESAWREPFAKFALNAGFELVVADESHRIKLPGGKASLFFSRLGRVVPRRLALTGTPMPHSPLDIYAQYRFLEPSIFGTSYVVFKGRYAVMGGFQNHMVVAFKNEADLNERMYRIAYRVGSEVLDLPEAVHVTRECTLSPQGERVYRELEKDLIAEIEGGTVTVANALVKLLRLRQVTSGYLKDDEGELHLVDEGKRVLLGDILEDLALREPIVIFAQFHQDLDAIADIAGRQGRIVAELSGRRNELALWQDGKADVLAVQMQSGGVGIDLTRARYCLYYSLGFSLGDYEQSLARVHRPGQKHPVTYIHLLAKGTVDEHVYDALDKRKQVVEAVLADMRGGE